MSVSGKSLIGFRNGETGESVFRAVAPATGENLEPAFHSASSAEVELATSLAHDAAPIVSLLSGRERAVFLRQIAANLEAIADPLVQRAHQETALPLPRLQGELARTCGQLRHFAGVVEDGSWTAPRIDRAIPDRKPLPKPDIRSVLRPLGPVVVFGASNFPLAFSVAGGDTASALAAGNPVIVKAHSAHPGASELAGVAIRKSIQQCRLPEGVFSLLFDSGTSVGAHLVKHPLIKAGAFTGSYRAGRALFDLASRRPEPIPFFAEMASTNPVFLLPGALTKRADQLAANFYNSFTLGGGQFCTKPGLVFVDCGNSADSFITSLREKVAAASSFTLLTAGIAASFGRDASARGRTRGVQILASGKSSKAKLAAAATAALYEIDLHTFLAEPDLSAEHFGPSSLLVRYQSKDQILACAKNLSGHLTATIHGSPEDLDEYAELIRVLETRVGRIIFNGFPTGVEATHAMVHGGPFPSTSDSRTTSVGSLAILRFARPVCYQDFPDAALPPELRNSNPLDVWRLVDGEFKKDPLP
jgi:NADP-dependent aldehyde dehydrogenase